MYERMTGDIRYNISNSGLGGVIVYLPKISTQIRIAEILSAYDDAIENNNRRITLLEKTARELYREWFVRFRFPGHERTEFVNGLPEGWEVDRLDKYCHVTDGTHDTPKETKSGVPLITGKCINDGFIDFNRAYLISETDHENIKRRSGLNSGDILFSNIGTVGNACVVNYDREFSVKNVIIFKPDGKEKTSYLYYMLTSKSLQDIFASQTSGSSQQFVGLSFMRGFRILVPSKLIISRFAEYIVPLIDAKQLLQAQSQNLARQRDLLLPRLMSGKLDAFSAFC
jgi:type I restriction enzyme S subunit